MEKTSMKGKTYPAVITAIFLAVVLFPLFQQLTGVVPAPRLEEKRRLSPAPSLTWKTLASGEFQKQFDRFMNDNYGMRAWLVMLNNQIDSSIFHVSQ